MSLLKISFSRLFAGALISLFLLAGLTVAVNYFGMFREMDNAVLRFLFNARGPILTQIFLAFTFLGKPSFILSATFILAIFLFFKKAFHYFLLFSGTVFGSAVFFLLLKNLVHRPRPELFSPLVRESSFAFPSAHASVSITFFGLMAYLAASMSKTRRARVNIFFLWFFLVFGIGLSRLYLGAHYPTDVFAGYLCGLIFLCIGIGLFEEFFKKD